MDSGCVRELRYSEALSSTPSPTHMNIVSPISTWFGTSVQRQARCAFAGFLQSSRPTYTTTQASKRNISAMASTASMKKAEDFVDFLSASPTRKNGTCSAGWRKSLTRFSIPRRSQCLTTPGEGRFQAHQGTAMHPTEKVSMSDTMTYRNETHGRRLSNLAANTT